MDNKIIAQEAPLSQLQLQLMQMGFDLNDIKQAIKLTNDKQKIVQNLLTKRQLKTQQLEAQIMSLDKPKDLNQMKDQNQQDDGFQDEQEDYKMVFLARMDIKLGLGKMAAQVATSALAAFKQIQAKSEKDQLAQIAYYEWLQSGQKKIVVKVNSEAEILELAEVIRKENINIYLNRCKKQDELEIPEGTITVAAVGPAPEDLLDKLTRHLKLF